MTNPSLSIIIVTFNSRSDLNRCLSSFTRGTECEIIVVDNHSTDGTVDFLREAFPRVTIIANDENKGFAAANNQGLREASGTIVLFLNPDTVVRNDAFRIMMEFLAAHPEVWTVGPRMLNADGTEQRTGVRFPNTWNIFCESLFFDRLFPTSRLFGRHKELYVDSSLPREVDYLQGSCLMVRGEAIESIGLLDEKFFMYFEETDWCYRVKHHGGKVYRVPAAEVVHLGGGEFGHYDVNRLQYYHASLMYFYRKHYTSPELIILRAILLARSVLRLFAWSVYRLVRPSVAAKALSSIKGYLRTIGLVVRRVP